MNSEIVIIGWLDLIIQIVYLVTYFICLRVIWQNITSFIVSILFVIISLQYLKSNKTIFYQKFISYKNKSLNFILKNRRVA